MDAETLSTLILLGSFLVMILLRFPIAYAVGISTALCLVSMGQSLISLPQLMVKGVWSFSLMAVPFFITMGVLMGSGGISDKLIALANSLGGWVRGGRGVGTGAAGRAPPSTFISPVGRSVRPTLSIKSVSPLNSTDSVGKK